MEINPSKPTYRGPDAWFTGEVWIDPIAEPDARSDLSVISVRFARGARTAWHAHVSSQLLLVTEGEGLVQSRGGPVESIGPGDVVHTHAHEWHWHGASEHCGMTHTSITAGPATFGAHVTDAEHRGEADGTVDSDPSEVD